MSIEKIVLTFLMISSILTGPTFSTKIDWTELEQDSPQTFFSLIKGIDLSKETDQKKVALALISMGSALTIEELQTFTQQETVLKKGVLSALTEASLKCEDEKNEILKILDGARYDPEREKFEIFADLLNQRLSDENPPKSGIYDMNNIHDYIPKEGWFFFVARGALQLLFDDPQGHFDLFKGLWKQKNKTSDMIICAGEHLFKYTKTPGILYPYWEYGMFASDFMCVMLANPLWLNWV